MGVKQSTLFSVQRDDKPLFECVRVCARLRKVYVHSMYKLCCSEESVFPAAAAVVVVLPNTVPFQFCYNSFMWVERAGERVCVSSSPIKACHIVIQQVYKKCNQQQQRSTSVKTTTTTRGMQHLQHTTAPLPHTPHPHACHSQAATQGT